MAMRQEDYLGFPYLLNIKTYTSVVVHQIAPRNQVIECCMLALIVLLCDDPRYSAAFTELDI